MTLFNISSGAISISLDVKSAKDLVPYLTVVNRLEETPTSPAYMLSFDFKEKVPS